MMKQQPQSNNRSLALLLLAGLILAGLVYYSTRTETGSAMKFSAEPDENQATTAQDAWKQGAGFLSGGLRPSRPSSPSPNLENNLRERLAEVRARGMERMTLETKMQEENFRNEFYGPRLAELGLSSEQMEKVLAQLAAMRDKAVIVGDATLELLQQRAAHNEEMLQLLGEKGHERYRQLESEKSSYRQLVAEIIPFAKKQNVVLQPETQSVLVRQLAIHGLTTMETWEGPYDPMPRPSIGVQPAIELAQRK